MLKSLLRFMVPLRSIAKSLERLVALYEADLDARQIYPVTETPNEDMTQVWYGDDDAQPVKGGKKRQGKPEDWFNQDLSH